MSENGKRDPLLISKREAATALSVSVRTIENLIAAKQLPARKVFRRTLIPYSAVSALARTGTHRAGLSTEMKDSKNASV